MGDQGAGRGDESIDHHRLAMVGGGQDAAGDAADLEAADLGQNVQAVGLVRPVDIDALLDGPRAFWPALRRPRPVPRPTPSRSRATPVTTAPMAADGVVLPMPISPVPMISTPLSKSWEASSKPVRIAVSASCLVMAGPLTKLAVPLAIFFHDQTGRPPRSSLGSRSGMIPKSTTQTSALTCRDMALIPAPPTRNVWTNGPGDFLRVGAHAVGHGTMVPGHDEHRPFFSTEGFRVF